MIEYENFFNDIKKCGINNFVASREAFCLDIETTQLFNIGRGYNVYDYSLEHECYERARKLAFPYIWMFGCTFMPDRVYYGREFRDLKFFLEELSSFFNAYDLYIYVHNLSFEFVFIRNLFSVEKVFCRKAHSIIYAIFAGINNIQFRCSYFLTRMSLEDWGKKIGVEKKVGDLDYNVIRTPYTKLSDKEIGYCEGDILVMLTGIKEYIAKYGNVAKIPLTQTGEVRREVREVVKENGLRTRFSKAQPLDLKEYSILNAVKRGGDSHASFKYAGRVLVDIENLDYSSSYPFSMVTKKFPKHRFEHDKFKHDCNKAYVCKVIIKNLKQKVPLSYIAKSKCEYVAGGVYDNGRVMRADELISWFNELDMEIIEDAYEFSNLEILECYSSVKDYLPKPIVELIFRKFKYKTQYKGVCGYEGIYQASKEFINSIYGMSITSLLQDEIYFNDIDGSFSTPIFTEKVMQELFNKATGVNKITLPYSTGIWTASYSRKMLWDGFKILGYDNVAYYDTDSYKGFFKDDDVKKINDINFSQLKNIQELYGLDEDLVFPVNYKGKREVLGKLVRESDYKEFKTLGAKKYIYKNCDDKIVTTIAGLPKKASNFFKNVDDLVDGVVVPPSYSKKMCMYYNEEQEHVLVDGYEVLFDKGAVLMPIPFKNNVTDEYMRLIGGFF